MNTDFWFRMALGMFIIVGVWNAFAPGMIFGWLGDFLEKHIHEHFLKPVFTCPCCMASVWGTTIWFLTGGDVYYWPFFVIALSGLMKFIPISFLQK
jgi:hypothetical protein